MKTKSALEKLLAVMAKLRSPQGCPWDREQDHMSLRQHAVEEVYELMDAIEARDDQEMAEELGDLLLQVVFHCQLARERGAFDFEQVARRITDKLLRRHPHVFGDVKVKNVDEVWANWEKIKTAEKHGTRHARPSALDGIPKHLPALLRAEKLLKKARKAKLAPAAALPVNRRKKAGLARELFDVARMAHDQGWSAEELLRAEIARQERAWRRIEKAAEKNEMTFLPIVVRELRVAARRKKTYTARFGAVSACIAFGCYNAFVFQTFMGKMGGAMMFSWLAGLAFLVCLSLSSNTVDCISEEKREGTLGFLFLTDLKGHDITLGKLFSCSLISFYSLLGILPVVALSLLFGGVSAAEFWEAALALLNVFFFTQSAGLFVSAFSRKRSNAGLVTGLILLLYTAGFYFLSSDLAYLRFPRLASLFQWLNLTYCVYWACTTGGHLAGPFASRYEHYWSSFLFIHLNAWLFLALASWWIPRSWQEKPARKRGIPWKERLLRQFHERYTPRPLLLDRNPFLWLSVRNRLGSRKVWATLLGLNGIWLWVLLQNRVNDNDDVYLPVFIAAILSNHLVLKLFAASEASGNLEEQRHSGALEYLLCCTPLTTEDVIEGQWLAIRRHLLRPAMTVLAADFVLLLAISLRHDQNLDADDKRNFALFVLGVAVMLIADIIALGWVGMWSAMSQRKPRHAAGRAFAQVLLLPWFFLISLAALSGLAGTPIVQSFGGALTIWFITGIIVDFAAGFLAWNRLMAEFRTRAAPPLEDEPGLFARLGRTLGLMTRGKI